VAGAEVEPGEATQIEGAVYGADVDVASRKIFLRDGAAGVSRVLLLHEIAHLLTPTPAEPHGPAFVRSFVDLIDRFVPLQSVDLRVAHYRRQVRFDLAPSPYAPPATNPFIGVLETNESMMQLHAYLQSAFEAAHSPDQ
jgi:hypothetical protein